MIFELSELEPFEAFIFDCDGTLTNSMPLHYVAWRDTMAKYGIDFPEEKFYSMAGMPSDKVIATLSNEQSVTVDVQAALNAKEDEFLKNLPLLKKLDFTVGIAEKFQGSKPMAVASGGTLPIVMAQLEHLGITRLFQTIVTAEHTKKHKPEPDVFLEAARRLNVQPANCLVFEDADLGVQAAAAAGMKWIDIRQKPQISLPAPHLGS